MSSKSGTKSAKRPALSEIDNNIPSKKPKKNVGGASKLEWFNVLCEDPRLKKVLDHLKSKITNTTTTTTGCHHVHGFTKDTRPVADKSFQAIFRNICDDAPERYSPYVIAIACAGKKIPDYDPPRLPAELRQVKQRRSATAEEGNGKDATWVCSHLCHDRQCVNPEHLVWEPSWMNRLRDNCRGGEECVHRPDRCLQPHRPVGELIDWTKYLD